VVKKLCVGACPPKADGFVVINQLTIHFVMDILDKQEAGDIPVARTPELAKLQETSKEFEELINLSPFF
jgi:hypothetical protein